MCTNFLEVCNLIWQPLQHGRFDFIIVVVELITHMHLQIQRHWALDQDSLEADQAVSSQIILLPGCTEIVMDNKDLFIHHVLSFVLDFTAPFGQGFTRRCRNYCVTTKHKNSQTMAFSFPKTQYRRLRQFG